MSSHLSCFFSFPHFTHLKIPLKNGVLFVFIRSNLALRGWDITFTMYGKLGLLHFRHLEAKDRQC